MELSNYLPFIMLLVFSAMSWRVWKSESNDQKVLMICMGWAGIAVLSLVGSIILFVAGGIFVPTILFTLSPVAAYVANQFKNVQRT
ncbi:hypothetical protein [Paraglaciecola hydrolytica]|jgi:hypothetical protein|uniref:Uncharacterized protein n=1 Tax=Paraglaciecola hydrolytica TaxID=1799789 RepID=A0A136A1R4_9ALTE|nr:hypothetical protein [Paraglaciecola hydrolytica]KXI29137.1 hypothetical protein AX660_13355 [Paraglaciecola hydrolytica]